MKRKYLAAAACLAFSVSSIAPAMADDLKDRPSLMDMLRSSKSAAKPAAEKAAAVRAGANTVATKRTERRRAAPKAAASKIDPMTTASVTQATASGDRPAPQGPSAGAAAPSAMPYGDLIATYAKQYGVPLELASAVVKIESNFNPKARGAHGEVGLMQIKPATARAMGYTGTVAGLYDPDTNLKFGMKYLAMAHQLGGGDTCGAILRYNAGHGATRMNPISRQYCTQVQAMLGEKA